MTEPTAEAPASAEPAAPAQPPETPVSETAQALEKKELSIRDLIEAGVHFGHQTRRWNPRMKSFLFGERNGVHIVDLDQTLPRFQEALDFVREIVASGGKVLFVATKRQAQAPIQLEAQRSGQYYVNNRWLGGMLTNFKTVKKSIERYKELLTTVADEEKVAALSKKELARINRWIDKYRKSLDGIREMTRLPDAVFIVDVGREAIGVKEAQRLGIPIIAVVDSNCSPDGIYHVIPGNDDSIRAIQLYCGRVADACIEGAQLFNERIQSEVAEEEKEQMAAAPTGRVVVEIKQPGGRRRGAAAHAGGRGGREDEAAPEAAATPVTPATPAAPAAPAPAAPAPAAPAAAPEPASPATPPGGGENS